VSFIDVEGYEVMVTSRPIGCEILPPDDLGGWNLDTDIVVDESRVVVTFIRRRSWPAECLCEAMRRLVGYEDRGLLQALHFASERRPDPEAS
jgi:hypothetical protein